MDLSNRVVMLTGASQGIGKAAAYAFAQAGCCVILVARTVQPLQDIVADIGDRQALAVQADITCVAEHAALLQQAVDRFGRIDILVNNAGIGLYATCEELVWSDLHAVMAVNFFGAAHLTKLCIPIMKAQGGGLIINLSSLAGRRSGPRLGAYSASKAALELLTEAWRLELADANIRFSTLYPGPVDTSFKSNALGTASSVSSPVKRVMAEQVAKRLIEVARREPRDAYMTNRDRLRVLLARLVPGLADRIVHQHYATPGKGTE